MSVKPRKPLHIALIVLIAMLGIYLARSGGEASSAEPSAPAASTRPACLYGLLTLTTDTPGGALLETTRLPGCYRSPTRADAEGLSWIAGRAAVGGQERTVLVGYPADDLAGKLGGRLTELHLDLGDGNRSVFRSQDGYRIEVANKPFAGRTFTWMGQRAGGSAVFTNH